MEKDIFPQGIVLVRFGFNSEKPAQNFRAGQRRQDFSCLLIFILT